MKFRHIIVAAIGLVAMVAVSSAIAQNEPSVGGRLARLAQQNAAQIEIGMVQDFALKAPPTGWIVCDGRVLDANTPHKTLRQRLIDDGFTYGQDGNGNPRIPDARGRVSAGVDNMGGTAANRLTAAASGVAGTTLGAAGGAETHTLTVAQMPTHAHGVTDPGHAHGVADPGHAHTVYDPGHAHVYQRWTASGGSGGGSGNNGNVNTATDTRVTGIGIYAAVTGIGIHAAATGISIQNNGSGAAHPNVQPTIAFNKIIFAGS